jgi:hypothetical protein
MCRDSLSDFTDGYIACALWTSQDDDGNSFDHLDRDDIDPDTLAVMRNDCRTFFIANEQHILCDGGPTGNTGQASMAGHDFWLTRNGHGAGYWDGDWPEPHASALDKAAKLEGETTLYRGDDGKLHHI